MMNVVPVKLGYKYYEPASGEVEKQHPVFFLHGTTLSKESFQDIPQIVADGTKRKVYALDARNHGDSEHSDAFNFDINVDDIFHFMDTINAQKAVLVGHSMGGITAIKAALTRPDRIEMIFSEDMYTKKVPKEMLNKVAGFIDVWSAAVQSIPKECNNYSEAVDHAAESFYSNLPPDTPDLPSKDVFLKYGFVFDRKPDGCYDVKFNKEAVSKAFSNAETLMSESIGHFDGPAYFIYGNLSEFRVWEEAEDIKKHFPNAELIEIEGATHNVHIEFPEKFANILIERLNC